MWSGRPEDWQRVLAGDELAAQTLYVKVSDLLKFVEDKNNGKT